MNESISLGTVVLFYAMLAAQTFFLWDRTKILKKNDELRVRVGYVAIILGEIAAVLATLYVTYEFISG